MTPKFKYGDKVIVSGYKATVVSVIRGVHEYNCRVRWDNKNLMPPEMEYKENELKFEGGDLSKCPVCNSKWNVVKFNMNTWKDCMKCGKKEEDIISAQSIGTKDKMLDAIDVMLTDYDDDFGFFKP